MSGDKGARWCPICEGAKRPSDEICQACGIRWDQWDAEVKAAVDEHFSEG